MLRKCLTWITKLWLNSNALVYTLVQTINPCSFVLCCYAIQMTSTANDTGEIFMPISCPPIIWSDHVVLIAHFSIQKCVESSANTRSMFLLWWWWSILYLHLTFCCPSMHPTAVLFDYYWRVSQEPVVQTCRNFLLSLAVYYCKYEQGCVCACLARPHQPHPASWPVLHC